MDEEKRRRRALEAGREMLESYKSKRSNKRLNKSLEQVSDEDSFHNEVENQSMDLRSISNNENGLSRDITFSSVSMSEGEGDGDLECLAGRVTELEELLQGKEAVVEALNAEIGHLRVEASSPTSSHSQTSNINCREIIAVYHTKFQEFEHALKERDGLIEDLTTSLQQALAARDVLLQQISNLNSTQAEHSPEENVFDGKISALENDLGNQKKLVSELASRLEQAQQNVKKLELEKETQNTELSDYKDQVENLNKKIRADSVENDFVGNSETHQLQKQEEQIEKIKKDMKIIVDKFAAETKANRIRHENEIKDLKAKHEAELQKLKQENQDLEARHLKEMSALQSQLSDYKHKVETLKLDLVTHRDSHSKERELLGEQIKLHKLQLDEITAKYVATATVLDSKESIERSLEQALNDAAVLKTENESLKFKLDDLSSRYSAAQGVIENNQLHERTLSSKIFTLEKSLSRLSGISIPELDETAYQTLDEMTIQYQIAKQKLDEKAEMEDQLKLKIEELENLVSKTKNELESANHVKDSYEKQMKDMKNTCDRLKNELNARFNEHQRFSTDSLDAASMENVDVEHEILVLRQTIGRRDKETADYMKKLEELGEFNKRLMDESEKLKNGLATAYAQCAIFEEKLDQTLGFGESKLDDSTLLNETQSSNTSSVEPEEVLHKQMNYNKVLKKLDACREQLKEYEREKTELVQQIENVTKEKQEILANIQSKEEQYRGEIEALKMEAVAESQKFHNILKGIEEGNEGLKLLRVELEEKHAKEMEDLRTYFEEKCLQMEKQYSEEIFSQQSKKMSDNDSELEELTEDLYVGGGTVECVGNGNNGGGDASGPLSKKARRDSPPISNSEELHICSEERIAKMAAEYEEKLENLRKQLIEVKEKSGRTVLSKAVNQFCQTERGSPSPMQESCKELNELRADYNRQLEEQVGLARIDIINALQEQIQALITVESETDENWPTELLELRNKFTSNSKREMQALKDRHALEMKRLKEMNDRMIKNLQDKITRIKSDGHESLQNNLLKERDKLHRTCLTLKGLVSQLIEYFANCEEELNSTLISEVLRKQFSPRISNSPFPKDQNTQVKRVHFAPQSSEIASIVSSDSNLQDLFDSEKDVTKILKKDLDACLERLRTESAKILVASSSDSESWSTGVGEYPNDKMTETERILAEFQEENELLKVKVKNLQQRLLNVENKKEVVSEGYGDPDESVREEPDEDFSQLQDRAKYVVLNGSNDTGYLLQLIEELCKYSDKRFEDLNKEKEDLQHQQVSLVSTPPQNIHRVCCAKIEAADKQLRSTRKFQEEQAVERETERDEAAKQIQQLQERLREREREKDREHRVTSSESALSPGLSSPGSSTLRQIDDTVDALTSQLQSAETEKAKVESELKTAVSKIWELRELIRDLEQQLQSRVEREEILGKQIEQLEEVIVAQTKNQQELVQELELVKSGSENNQLSDHIGHLQEELRKHQLSSEQLTANSSALKQLRLELRDLQLQLSRKTREIEALHVCVSTLSLSQPSEDVSIRDQIDATRCQTPDDPTSPPILPLDHVLKLKDNLLKHFRAEDVALKRLKDLELQVGNLQRQNEELLAEQELLQQTTSEQLFQIETLRARLEQQRRNAPFAQREATSKLESQLYETHERLELAERALTDKDAELAEVKSQLERVSRILAEKETEIANVVLAESDTTKKLKDTIRILEEENTLLQAKLSIQDKPQTNLPQIIDNMLAEKNAEIDHLRDQLAKREKQLEAYLSLDEHQLRDILRQSEHQKNSARTLSDILSINSECEELSEMREAPSHTRTQNVSNFKVPNSVSQTAAAQMKRDVVDYSQAITETPKVPRLELDSCSHSDETANSNLLEVSREMESLQMQLNNLPIASPTLTDVGTQDSITSEEPNEYLCPRHGRMKNTNSDVDRAKNALKDMVTIQRIQELEIQIFELKEELTNKNAALEQREAELLDIQNNLQQLNDNISSLNDDRLFYKAEYEKAKDNESKIQMDFQAVENVLMKRTEELEDYREKLQVLQDETNKIKHDEAAVREKIEEITNLKEIIAEKDITIETLQTRTIELEDENKQLYEYRCKFNDYQRDLLNYQTEIQRLNEGLNTRDQMIRRLEEIARRSSLSGGSSPSEKDQEIFHLQEYLKEKDKVIRQMSDDSKSLQRALETIQNKMKESGNIVELRRKLKEERKTNAELTEEIVKLRTEVEMLSTSRRNDDDNDIAEMVQRELNLSARLDQQLLNVIDSEPEDVLKKCGDLKQANKVIDELNRLKDDLDIDREMLKSQIAEYESRILQLKADNDEHSKRIGKLEEEISKERHTVKSLQLQLRKEKKAAEEAKLNDTELIKQLNIKLHESLEIRDRLALEKKNLEMMNSMNNQNRKSPEIEAEQKKTLLTLSGNLELERRKCEELQEALKKMETENKSLGDQLQAAKVEIEKLMSSVDLENLAKEQLKADLQRAKEELKTKTKECDWHKSILKTVSDAEEKRKHQRSKEHSEVKALREELKNTQEILNDFDTDMKTLKEQLTDAAERENQLTRCIKSLTDEETELTEQLAAVKNEEKKLRDIIVDQQNEIKLYMRKEIDLADELRKERLTPELNSSPSKVLQRVKALNATIDRLTQEKMHLYEKVERLREENERYFAQIRFLETQLSQKNRDHPSTISRNDSEERLQHFYGKFLRSDSRRKALIYQKHYLLCIIAGYQHSEENTLAFLAQLTQSQRSIARRGANRRNGLLRFRSAVLLVIATQRMKWLILRWRTGRRVGANVVLGSMERQPASQPTRSIRSAPSGHSPPVRERASSNGTSGFSSYPYYRRLAEIQQNLHLRVPESNIDSYKSD